MDSYNMLMMEVSAISISRRGVWKFPRELIFFSRPREGAHLHTLEENHFAYFVKHVVNSQKPLRPLRLKAQLMTRTNAGNK